MSTKNFIEGRKHCSVVISARDLATILHALRRLQENGRIEGCSAGDCDHFDVERELTNIEIDTLCETLNAAGGWNLNPHCW